MYVAAHQEIDTNDHNEDVHDQDGYDEDGKVDAGEDDEDHGNEEAEEAEDGLLINLHVGQCLQRQRLK